MLSLQGMIAKDLEAKGVLPQKFKDLTLGPKYKAIKFIRTNGTEPTGSILDVGSYKFIQEDGTELDYAGSDWELVVHTYQSAVRGGSSYVSKFYFDNDTKNHLLQQIWHVYYGPYRNNNGNSLTANIIFAVGATYNANAYSYAPGHVYIKIAHSKTNPQNLTFSFVKTSSVTSDPQYTTVVTKTADCTKLELDVGSNSTRTIQGGASGNEGQVYLNDMKFIYNNRVILGE